MVRRSRRAAAPSLDPGDRADPDVFAELGGPAEPDGLAVPGPDRVPALDGPAEIPGVLVLEAGLDLNAASPLRSALLERRGSDLAVDASAVRHLGALCAQVLASAAATWAADGRSFGVRSPSDGFAQAARLLGLGSILITEGASS